VLRGATYNLVGRLATAGFPVILPMVAYWVYGQASMLKVAQSFNLTSYIAILGLSGMALPARDFRADRGDPRALSVHMRAYARLTLLQVGMASIALLYIWHMSRLLVAGFAASLEFTLLLLSLGVVQISIICTAVPAGYFISQGKHALPNVAAALCRAIAVSILLVSGFLTLPFTLIACIWIIIFCAYAVYVWAAALGSGGKSMIALGSAPGWGEFRSILGRSAVYLLWSILATAFLAVPLTYIAHRWPLEFGGMNFAFLIGSTPAAIVTAAMVPKSNMIQDVAGGDGHISAILRSSWHLALIVLAASIACFLLTWPVHPLVVGKENVMAFRIAAPLVLLTTSIRLATWACTQCAIAVRSEYVVMLGPVAEALLALGLAWLLSLRMGAIGVPAGLVVAAAGRIVFMVLFEVPRLRTAWRDYGRRSA
jgi:O-antigen/teichoic acid export membrane protein